MVALETVLPYASAPVLFDGASSYSYELGFIDAGNYTAALTCQLNDEPEQNDEACIFAGQKSDHYQFRRLRFSLIFDPVTLKAKVQTRCLCR